jgi:hypothetical protein
VRIGGKGSAKAGSQASENRHQLAEKAREGTLTLEEQLEIEAYERVGNFLSQLQSKARSSLKRARPEVE